MTQTLYTEQTAANAVNFFSCHTVLTDNGSQFTLYKGPKEQHIVRQICHELYIKHRLTKRYHLWTNGQVESMNRTIKAR